MVIGIDGNEANVKDRVGVNNYAFEILWALYKLQDRSKVSHKFIIYLAQKPLEDMPHANEYWEYKVISGSKFWILLKLTPYLIFSKLRPDVLFSPSHYTTPFLSIPRVIAIMDLGYLDFSGQFKKITFWQLKFWTAISIFVSKHIISISNATKRDIVRHYPFASNKITVTHLAYNKTKFDDNLSLNDVRRIIKKYSIVDDYILFLSTLKPSKNVEGLISAFAQISKVNFPISNNKPVKLVIAGRKGWMYEKIYNRVQSLGLSNNVIFTGFVDEDDKPAILKGARLLISPSFTEGFGLHVLEAMAMKTPVIVSRVGSLPEIVEDAGIYVDPKNPESMAGGIAQVLNMNQKSYNDLKNKSAKQAQQFSWEKTAEKSISVLEKLKNYV